MGEERNPSVYEDPRPCEHPEEGHLITLQGRYEELIEAMEKGEDIQEPLRKTRESLDEMTLEFDDEPLTAYAKQVYDRLFHEPFPDRYYFEECHFKADQLISYIFEYEEMEKERLEKLLTFVNG